LPFQQIAIGIGIAIVIIFDFATDPDKKGARGQALPQVFFKSLIRV
jgi:hypothetical protein